MSSRSGCPGGARRPFDCSRYVFTFALPPASPATAPCPRCSFRLRGVLSVAVLCVSVHGVAWWSSGRLVSVCRAVAVRAAFGWRSGASLIRGQRIRGALALAVVDRVRIPEVRAWHVDLLSSALPAQLSCFCSARCEDARVDARAGRRASGRAGVVRSRSAGASAGAERRRAARQRGLETPDAPGRLQAEHVGVAALGPKPRGAWGGCGTATTSSSRSLRAGPVTGAGAFALSFTSRSGRRWRRSPACCACRAMSSAGPPTKSRTSSKCALAMSSGFWPFGPPNTSGEGVGVGFGQLVAGEARLVIVAGAVGLRGVRSALALAAARSTPIHRPGRWRRSRLRGCAVPH